MGDLSTSPTKCVCREKAATLRRQWKRSGPVSSYSIPLLDGFCINMDNSAGYNPQVNRRTCDRSPPEPEVSPASLHWSRLEDLLIPYRKSAHPAVRKVRTNLGRSNPRSQEASETLGDQPIAIQKGGAHLTQIEVSKHPAEVGGRHRVCRMTKGHVMFHINEQSVWALDSCPRRHSKLALYWRRVRSVAFGRALRKLPA
ncbi:hypothetical protein BV25DRAFT_1178005 [Artomyces pyxidatus]|uniref:Uncharacterized protein n=1 Tax=Artomyces pyxidatus TaxID=48021 RepID=A0ACB8STD2_9AGAM|nr:hypothetical protein BV25DRAFT_1178005 [Artomyces pyxidatus]